MNKEQKDAIYWHLNKLEAFIKTYEGYPDSCDAMHSLGFIQGTIDLLIQLDKEETGLK